MDLAAQLLDAWRINCAINHFLFDGLTDDQFEAKLTKGKSVSGQIAHMHNVRRMWARAVDVSLGDSLTKLEPASISRSELKEALEASDAVMAKVIEAGLESGRVKNFKPNPVAFVCYFMAHEGNHRAQVELAVRQAGIPITVQQEFGQWEWGKF